MFPGHPRHRFEKQQQEKKFQADWQGVLAHRGWQGMSQAMEYFLNTHSTKHRGNRTHQQDLLAKAKTLFKHGKINDHEKGQFRLFVERSSRVLAWTYGKYRIDGHDLSAIRAPVEYLKICLGAETHNLEVARVLMELYPNSLSTIMINHLGLAKWRAPQDPGKIQAWEEIIDTFFERKIAQGMDMGERQDWTDRDRQKHWETLALLWKARDESFPMQDRYTQHLIDYISSPPDEDIFNQIAPVNEFASYIKAKLLGRLVNNEPAVEPRKGPKL